MAWIPAACPDLITQHHYSVCLDPGRSMWVTPAACLDAVPQLIACGLPGEDAVLARHLRRWGGCERRAGGCGCWACPSARSPPTQIRRTHVRTCLSAQARAHGSRSFNLKLLAVDAPVPVCVRVHPYPGPRNPARSAVCAMAGQSESWSRSEHGPSTWITLGESALSARLAPGPRA
jgi:hypothetical protein